MMEEVGPAKLRYAVDDNDQPQPAQEKKEKPGGQKKKPQSYYTLPEEKGAKKGSSLMKKKVSLKVEDLLKAGRSHFEIPKSKQEEAKRKKASKTQKRG